MTIRFLTNDDVIDYSILRKNSLIESPFAFSDSYEDQENKSMSDYQSEIMKWGNPLEAFTLGAFNEAKKLVGFVRFKRDQRTKARHRASLHSLYVKPEYRGQGLAKMLVNELLKIVEEVPGIEQLQLSSIASHISIIEFYEKLGFQKLGGLLEKDLIINGKYVDAWYMVKHLKQQR
jgi:ribosomal protein S18 acetylase RimI-like enzyme